MDYDVVILGGGVSGTALLYTLTKYTTIKRIALFEKRDDYGLVASHSTQNSQTLHFGDIETNYSFAKAKSVSQGARFVQNFLDIFDVKKKVHTVVPKMVIAVGAQEVLALRARYEEFKVLFPKLKLIERAEIAKREPKVVEGRNPKEEIIALVTPDGYTVDYHKLSKLFVSESKKLNPNLNQSVYVGYGVDHVEKITGGYLLTVGEKQYRTKTLIVNAGAMSIWFAKMLNYGKHLSIFSVAGNFYRGPEVLNGKVYTMQLAKLPFAAAHGDPDVHAKGYTRFGPSAKPVLRLERDDSKSVKYYLKTFKFNWAGIASVFTIAFDPTYAKYMAKNYLYEIPYFGARLFAKNAQKIVPTIKASQIKKDKGYGGARPQIIDTEKRSISMGEARIEGNKVNFNITPSPGASTCLANAFRDTQDLVKWLNKTFDEKQMKKDLLVK